MQTEQLDLGGIPALVWGPPGDGAVVAVHGNLSHKADTPIQLLAEAASARALQVLSFDLPGHGGRKDEPAPCRIQVCVPELRAVMGYAKKRWAHVGLFACSLGACFSLAAYADEPLEQALFLSPVLDMRRLIENMMGWFGVTQERLCRERAIETPTGETLYWDYYCYVKEHPVRRWDTPTSILCGGRVELCVPDVTARFARQYGCRLLTRPEAGHYFHTPKELEALRQWLTASL